jgi:predicted DCC family thiol-disulfide oxidoreductase YuxK
VPSFPDDRPVIIFDGKCVLCSGFAQFVLRHDRNRVFRLMTAQSSTGTALYRHYGLDPLNYQTNVLIEDGKAWFKAEGSVRMFQRLGFPWSMLTVLRFLPSQLTEKLYDVVARNRLRWFGARDVCFVPAPTDADRFLT